MEQSTIEQLTDELKRAFDKIESAKYALEFYANSEHYVYKPQTTSPTVDWKVGSAASNDAGKLARETLKSL